jgi:SAM-dependent methyltransferase
MSRSVYDDNAEFYLDFVDRGLADDDGHLDVLMSTFTRLLGDRLADARVCDVACGEGYLGRHLARSGAREVLGIDLSTTLIHAATRRADSPNLVYRVDDAHELRSIPDRSFDVAVSQLALMDIADHRRMFRAVRRMLTGAGVFVFSLLHPCFDGAPFHFPDEPKYTIDENGVPVACVIRRYATEGFWNSGGTGVRGHMGSYHRMLSTYINDLLASGFRLERLEEPVLPRVVDRGPENDRGAELFSELPLALVVAAQVC